MIDKRTEYATRYEILNMLSPEETAHVSNTESGRIPEGEEYVDLEHLDRGVLRAAPNTPGANALSRADLQDSTWRKILRLLPMPS